MSPSSSALRGRVRRWVAAGAVLFAVTATGIPAASAATAHVSTKSSSGTKASGAVSTGASTDNGAGTAKTGKTTKPAATTGAKAVARPQDAVPDLPNLNGEFVPIAPDRVLDTRVGTGTGGVVAKVGQNPLMLNVSGITGNASVVPTAVVLNVTVVAPTKNTYIGVYPNGDGPTSTSNLNVMAGKVVANQVTVQVGQGGMIDFYNADGVTDLVADVAGYYTVDEAGSTYVPDGPSRVLDTRSGIGGVTGPVGPGKSVSLKIGGANGIPAGVSAVVLNVTATEGTANSYLTVYPNGTNVPSASSLNFPAGHNVANLVTVQVGANGEVNFYNNLGDTQIIADLAGYFVSGAPQTGGVYEAAGPTRILDTRSGIGAAKSPVSAGQHIALQVAGVGPVPSTGVTAVVLNVTAVSATKNSFLTVYPDGENTPSSSNVNFAANQTVPNLVVVPVGADGKVDISNNQGDVEVLADIFGYYVADSNLAVSALSWSSPTVDASAGVVTNTLNFTVTDSDPAATQTSGDLEIRQRGSGANTYVGEPFYIGFNPQIVNSSYWATFVSGNAASSTYSFTFPVPEYSGATDVTWAVSLVTLFDSPGNEQAVYAGSELDGLGDSFTATEQVSTITPTYQFNGVTTNNITGSPAVLNDGADTSAEYSIEAFDAQSGVSHGTIMVTGPGGKSLTGGFEAYYDGEQGEAFPCTDDGNNIFGTDERCQFSVYFPADEPAGTWSVTSVSLTNNAGQTHDYTGLDLAPITLTTDSTIDASDFSFTPKEVNNWTSGATATLSMKIGGAKDGISSIQVYTEDTGSFCQQPSTTPTLNANGTYSTTISIGQLGQDSTSCTIGGIEITDGAGDISLYGDEFQLPSLGLTVTNTPDTTPPVATSATLSITSLPQSEIPDEGNTVYITVDTKKLLAPIDGSGSTLYSSTGAKVGEEGGGAGVGSNGQLMIGIDIPYGLAVGTYTVGFSLTDAGGLTTDYGMPGSAAVPGGALKLTITAG